MRIADLRQPLGSSSLPPVIILAGGLGTRFAEETAVRPKPMIEVGGHPMLWHIMKYFGHYGAREFYIATGYKGDVIKRFFLDYFNLNGSMTLDLASGRVRRHEAECEDWTVHMVDTGTETMTGGRLKRLEKRIGNRTFMLTYGDGVCSVDPRALLEYSQVTWPHSHGNGRPTSRSIRWSRSRRRCRRNLQREAADR